MKKGVNKNYSLGKGGRADKSCNLGIVSPRLKKPSKLTIGTKANIRSGSVIYASTRIGDNFECGHNSIIREENKIGNNFRLWNGSVVDYGCKIGNNVKIHCNVYVAQYTMIEDDVFLAPGVIVSNDMHPGCKYSRKCMRGPVIKKGAKIGCNATILPFITIGENALVGAGSVVTKDVPPNTVVCGNPAHGKKYIYDIKCVSGLNDKPYKK